MSYRHLGWKKIKDAHRRDVFEHTDMYLHDVYRMFQLPKPGIVEGGGCNFSIALVILCIIDGIATEICPTRSVVRDQETRFKRLIRKKLHWGPANKGWVEKDQAAHLLYAEFRNPLVHQIAGDTVSRTRPRGYGEPAIGKWGNLPSHLHSIEKIDRLRKWKDDWPILGHESNRPGGPRMKLMVAGLYWAVKKMTRELMK